MPGQCFVLMPFKPPFDQYYSSILVKAIEKAGLIALRADGIYGPQSFIDDIFKHIASSKALIADVTGRNPNVNYELGIAHALRRRAVIISQSMDDVPSDYRHIRTIIYQTHEVGWELKLRNDIIRSLKTITRLGGDAIQSNELTGEQSFPPEEQLIELVLKSKNIDLMIAGGDSFYRKFYEVLLHKKMLDNGLSSKTNVRILLRRSSLASKRSAQQFEALQDRLGGSVSVRWYDWDFMLRGYCFDRSVAYVSYFLREKREDSYFLSGRYNRMVKVMKGESEIDDFTLSMFTKTFDSFFDRGLIDQPEQDSQFVREP